MLALLWCLASASPWACRQSASAPHLVWQLSGLTVTGAGNDQAQDWLQGLAWEKLAHLPEVHTQRLGPEGALPLMQVQLTLGRGCLRLLAAPADGFGPHFDALMPLGSSASSAAVEGVALSIDRALTDGLQAILAMQEADMGAPDQLMRLSAGDRVAAPRTLSPSGHEALQTFAIRRLAQRQCKEAAVVLRNLVVQAAEPQASPQQLALALQAVGSLMALCDRQAVLPMVALAQHQAPEFVVQMAHAISALGGPMAEAYLVTLATGHLDGVVRQGAQDALSALTLRRRSGMGCPGGRI